MVIKYLSKLDLQLLYLSEKFKDIGRFEKKISTVDSIISCS